MLIYWKVAEPYNALLHVGFWWAKFKLFIYTATSDIVLKLNGFYMFALIDFKLRVFYFHNYHQNYWQMRNENWCSGCFAWYLTVIIVYNIKLHNMLQFLRFLSIICRQKWPSLIFKKQIHISGWFSLSLKTYSLLNLLLINVIFI